MQIVDAEAWLVEGAKYNWTLLRLTADDGTTGVGEATSWPGSPIVLEAVRYAASRIIGLDPRRRDYIWSKLYRDLNWVGPFGASLCAISGIDTALLDLNAKRLGVPAYELLGGRYRDEIDLYANYWFTNGEFTPEDYARQARAVVRAGFTALKFDPFSHTNYLYGEDVQTTMGLTAGQEKLAVQVVAAVREAVGDDVTLLIETHALLNGPTAVRMADQLQPYRIGWYEEPAGPENPSTLAALRDRISLPLAVGERHHTRFGIREVLERQLSDYLMPDIARCGGPSELKRMAAMAEVYGIPIAPHNPNGPISTLVSGHVCAAIPNFYRLECIFQDVPWRDEVLTEPLAIRDGRLMLSDRPGLGVDLNVEAILAHPGLTDPQAGFYV